ncbi:MAG TPA: TetR/AcrR family transcriptional regulator [Propionibacteriaceae bacterium]
MSKNVKQEAVTQSTGGTRGYQSALRAERAALTRQCVLRAARDSFGAHGYAGSTVADIARRANVAVDTVYAAVGRKPALLRQLVETALSGEDVAVPAHERDYVTRIRASDTAEQKLTIYAAAVSAIQQRMSVVFQTLGEAATMDADCSALWTEISERRAANMIDLAADLRRTGELRADLSDRDVADVIWSMNGTEYWLLLVQHRGWSPERFERWLVDCWTRVLLQQPLQGPVMPA